MQEAGGLPAQEVAGMRGLVWEQSGEDLKAWVLVLKNTGLVTMNKSSTIQFAFQRFNYLKTKHTEQQINVRSFTIGYNTTSSYLKYITLQSTSRHLNYIV